MRSKNFNKRVAALEESVRMRPAWSAKVIERANLPRREKEILLQALRSRVAVVSHEELDHLNAAINALPAAERARLDQARGAAIIVGMFEADANL